MAYCVSQIINVTISRQRNIHPQRFSFLKRVQRCTLSVIMLHNEVKGWFSQMIVTSQKLFSCHLSLKKYYFPGKFTITHAVTFPCIQSHHTLEIGKGKCQLWCVKHNSESLMKIGWKIRMLWHFEVSQIFFLTSRYEYADEWVDDVITSDLPYILYIKFWKFWLCPNLWMYVPHILYILLEKCKSLKLKWYLMWKLESCMMPNSFAFQVKFSWIICETFGASIESPTLYEVSCDNAFT